MHNSLLSKNSILSEDIINEIINTFYHKKKGESERKKKRRIKNCRTWTNKIHQMYFLSKLFNIFKRKHFFFKIQQSSYWHIARHNKFTSLGRRSKVILRALQNMPNLQKKRIDFKKIWNLSGGVSWERIHQVRNLHTASSFRWKIYRQYLPSVSRSPIPQAKTAYRINLLRIFILASTSWWSIKVLIPFCFRVAYKSEVHVG